MTIGNITPKQLAARYRVSTPTIYRWARTGKIPPGVRLGKRVLRFNEIDIKEWEERKLGNDRTQSSETDVAGGSGVLPGAGSDSGSGETSQGAGPQRDQRAASIFATVVPEKDPVHQSATGREVDDLPRSP